MHDRVWLKKVLIPFWVVELGFLLVIIIFGSLSLASLVEEEAYYPTYYRGVIKALYLGTGVLLTMAIISTAFVIASIVLFARHRLNPITFLVFQCIKMCFWTYVFVASIINISGRGSFASSIIFSAPLFACSLGQLIYGSVIMHRKRKGLIGRGEYTGVKPSSQAWGGYESPPRGSYAGYNPQGAPPNPFRDTSRASSPNPAARQEPMSYDTAPPVVSHPAHRKGEAEMYYNTPGATNQSYELQNTGYRGS
ncbi:hypothetical protein LTR86_005117 [Recurvomyces mirabilis]|nr:hypothetical protein LTR86_005117 [Recurvomyces mirabilis]